MFKSVFGGCGKSKLMDAEDACNSPAPTTGVTGLLRRVAAGDEEAFEMAEGKFAEMETLLVKAMDDREGTIAVSVRKIREAESRSEAVEQRQVEAIAAGKQENAKAVAGLTAELNAAHAEAAALHLSTSAALQAKLAELVHATAQLVELGSKLNEALRDKDTVTTQLAQQAVSAQQLQAELRAEGLSSKMEAERLRIELTEALAQYDQHMKDRVAGESQQLQAQNRQLHVENERLREKYGSDATASGSKVAIVLKADMLAEQQEFANAKVSIAELTGELDLVKREMSSIADARTLEVSSLQRELVDKVGAQSLEIQTCMQTAQTAAERAALATRKLEVAESHYKAMLETTRSEMAHAHTLEIQALMSSAQRAAQGTSSMASPRSSPK